jgi:hypothetical protein
MTTHRGDHADLYTLVHHKETPRVGDLHALVTIVVAATGSQVCDHHPATDGHPRCTTSAEGVV